MPQAPNAYNTNVVHDVAYSATRFSNRGLHSKSRVGESGGPCNTSATCGVVELYSFEWQNGWHHWRRR